MADQIITFTADSKAEYNAYQRQSADLVAVYDRVAAKPAHFHVPCSYLDEHADLDQLDHIESVYKNPPFSTVVIDFDEMVGVDAWSTLNPTSLDSAAREH